MKYNAVSLDFFSVFFYFVWQSKAVVWDLFFSFFILCLGYLISGSLFVCVELFCSKDCCFSVCFFSVKLLVKSIIQDFKCIHPCPCITGFSLYTLMMYHFERLVSLALHQLFCWLAFSTPKADTPTSDMCLTTAHSPSVTQCYKYECTQTHTHTHAINKSSSQKHTAAVQMFQYKCVMNLLICCSCQQALFQAAKW